MAHDLFLGDVLIWGFKQRKRKHVIADYIVRITISFRLRGFQVPYEEGTT